MLICGIDLGIRNCAVAFFDSTLQRVALSHIDITGKATIPNKDLAKQTVVKLMSPLAIQGLHASKKVFIEEPIFVPRNAALMNKLWIIHTTLMVHPATASKAVSIKPLEVIRIYPDISSAGNRTIKKKRTVELARSLITQLSGDNSDALAQLNKEKADDMADALIIAFAGARITGLEIPNNLLSIDSRP